MGNIPVETEDEIGKLVHAFNRMSESLKRREKALLISEKRLRLLSSQLIEAQERERRRISKGLHDELGQALALLKHQLRAIEKSPKARNIFNKSAARQAIISIKSLKMYAGFQRI